MKTYLTLVLALFTFVIYGQNLNMEQVAHVEVDENLSDIWGYVAPDGTEYAIVGSRSNTLIYDLTDPSNPILVKSKFTFIILTF